MSGIGVGISQDPYYYGRYNFGSNGVPAGVEQPAVPVQALPAEVENPEEEPSLMDQCKTNVALFGGIKAVPHLRHPINSLYGLAKTMGNYKVYEHLNYAQQGEAFANLFESARLEPRMVNKEFTKKLAELRQDYLKALRSKNPVDIAEAGAKLKTFAARSKNGSLVNGVKNMYYNFRNPLPVAEGTGFWGRTASRIRGTFRGPTVDMAMLPAVESGAAAAKTVEAATAAAEAAKGLSGFQKVLATGKQWFKQGGGWFAVILESLMQIPELFAAYSEGERGDGVKQTVKSAVTVGINTAGWIAGAKVGALGGAKLGALVGSIFPGAGTAIGAAIGGFLGGLVGMAVGCWGASKASKAICGKSFTEKQAEKQAKQQQIAQQIYLERQKINPNYAINPFYQQGMQI